MLVLTWLSVTDVAKGPWSKMIKRIYIGISVVDLIMRAVMAVACLAGGDYSTLKRWNNVLSALVKPLFFVYAVIYFL